jgi:hypothetical protein
MQTMFTDRFFNRRRTTPRSTTSATDPRYRRRRPEPMPRMRWY